MIQRRCYIGIVICDRLHYRIHHKLTHFCSTFYQHEVLESEQHGGPESEPVELCEITTNKSQLENDPDNAIIKKKKGATT